MATAEVPTPVQQHVLDITTELLPTAIVKIDGVPYELHNQDTLPYLTYVRLAGLRRRIGLLTLKADTGDLTAAEEAELYALLDRQCRLVLDAPDDVHAKLNAGIRMDVYQAFLELPRAVRTPVAAKQEAPQAPLTSTDLAPIGATSVVGSSASTEVPIPAAG